MHNPQGAIHRGLSSACAPTTLTSNKRLLLLHPDNSQSSQHVLLHCPCGFSVLPLLLSGR